MTASHGRRFWRRIRTWTACFLCALPLSTGRLAPTVAPAAPMAARVHTTDTPLWQLVDAVNERAWRAYDRRQFALAEALFQEELRLSPGNPVAYWGLANCYADSRVRAYAAARRELARVLASANATLRTSAHALLANLPPDAVDASWHPNMPISYQDAIAMILSYRSDVLSTAPRPVMAMDGDGPSEDVQVYVDFAADRGWLRGIAIPSFAAPAPRLFLALFMARAFGLNRYDYIRPFHLTDMQDVPVDDRMIVDSVLANRLLTIRGANAFDPLAITTRSAFGRIAARANAIMSRPPGPGQWLTPPEPAAAARCVTMYSISTPDQSQQIADIQRHRDTLTGILFADYSLGSLLQSPEQALPAARSAIEQAALTSGERAWAVIGNYNELTREADPGIVDAALTNPVTVSVLIGNIARLAATQELQGVAIDFENLYPQDRHAFTSFIIALHKQLHAEGVLLMVCLPARDHSAHGASAYDYAKLGAVADDVMLLAYDEHTPSTQPGPIANDAFTARVIQYALQLVSRHKLLVGMADYGYDWSGHGATCVTMSQATALARAHQARIHTYATSGSATFTYVDATGARHVVWFQDDRSTALTAGLVREFGLAGVVIWHLGAQDSGFWAALTSALGLPGKALS